MAPVSLLVALSALAIFSCTFGTTPANALAIADNHNVDRHVAHNSLAKRRNDLSKRCKPRSQSAPAPASSSWTSSSSSWVPPPSTSQSWTPAPSPSPSSSPAPAPSSTPASSGSSGGGVNGGPKVGLAWALGDDPRLQMLSSHVGVIYTWSPDMPSNTYNLIRAPMLWGPNQVQDFKNVVVQGYAQYALGFNEPNESGQSNLDPGYAATLWTQNLAPLRALGYQLGSPAMSSRPNGQQWMSDFLGACNGQCSFDFLATHWYDVSFANFQTYLESWHTAYPMDIWVTEYACQNFNGGAQPDMGQIFDFYGQAKAYIESTPWIKMAAAFGFMDQMSNVNPLDQLLNGNTITDLGWVVLN